VIVCRSGARSHSVTQFLNSHGINAVNMSGGMRAWEKAGLPVVTDAGDPGLII
jgi:rhodanese-related sulfurtransferase